MGADSSSGASAEGPGARGRRHLSFLPGLAGLVCGIAYTLGAATYPVGTLSAPGPGFFPVLVGILLVLSSSICLLGEWRHPSAPPAPPGANFWRVPALALAIAGYVLLLKPVGFLLATAGLWTVVLGALGRRPLWLVALSGFPAAGLTYLLFQLLGVALPRGQLPF